MATLGDMKSRIAAEIFRSDLSAQIANAILDAIDTYQGDRFYFNEPSLATEPTFNTVPGQPTYDLQTVLASSVTVPIYDIDYLTYVQGNATYRIKRRMPEDIQLANQNGTISGPPDEFTFAGKAITLYPYPDIAYPISIFGATTAPVPATDIEANNPWMNDAEQLIRAHAKFLIATHITKNAALAKLMSPEEGGGPDGGPGETFRAWQRLKVTSNRLRATGKVAAMQF